MKSVVYIEQTSDKGAKRIFTSSDTLNEYYVTSAYLKDMITNFEHKYNRRPTHRWFKKYATFERCTH